MVIRRFEVWLCRLDPAVGSEIQKTRPCIIASPDEANRYLQVVTITPLTSAVRPYPSRVPCTFKRKTGQIAVDQIRTLDKSRLLKKVGVITDAEARALCDVISQHFAYSP